MNTPSGSYEFIEWKSWTHRMENLRYNANQIEMIDLNDIVNVTIWQTLFLTS